MASLTNTPCAAPAKPKLVRTHRISRDRLKSCRKRLFHSSSSSSSSDEERVENQLSNLHPLAESTTSRSSKGATGEDDPDEETGSDSESEERRNHRDWERLPLNSLQWMKRIVRYWKYFVNREYIRDIFFQYTPNEVLNQLSFRYLKDILLMYSPTEELYSDDELYYCHLMCSAVCIRRIELRVKHKMDFEVKDCHWSHMT